MPIFGTKTKVNTFNVSGNKVGVGGQDEMKNGGLFKKRKARKAAEAERRKAAEKIWAEEDKLPGAKTGGMINPNKAFNPFDLKSSNFKK